MHDHARDRTAAWTAAGLGGVVLAFVAPIGLASADAAAMSGVVAGARRPFAEAQPLADLLVRMVALAPIGPVGARAHAVAALAGVVALWLMARRADAGAEATPGWGRAAGLALLALSPPFLEAATVHPGVAVDLALFVWGSLLAGRAHADAARARAGLALALACGLASGAGWPVRLALWPMGLLVTLRALRLGQRWPLLAPAVFATGWVPFVGAVVASASPAPGVGQLFARLFAAPPHPRLAESLSAGVVALGNDVGVLAVLVGALGLWTLIRRPGPVLSVSVMMWLSLLVGASIAGGFGLARVTAVAALAMPVAAGIGAVSEVFGRARAAVALVVAVMVVVPAAWVGVGGAMAAPARRAPGVVSRRIDLALGSRRAAGAPPAATEAAAYTAPDAVPTGNQPR